VRLISLNQASLRLTSRLIRLTTAFTMAANLPSPFSERISRPAAPDFSHPSCRRRSSDSLDPSTSPLAATGQYPGASKQTELESRRGECTDGESFVAD
jgi:hypothetical protein